MRFERWFAKIGGVCWLLCVQFFVAEQIARLGVTPRYSMQWNYISDLGRIHCGYGCSHWHAVMNGSFYLQALLVAAGALLLPLRNPGSWLGLVSRFFLLLAARGLFGIAQNPADVHMNAHVDAAFLFLLTSTLAMVGWGVSEVVGRTRTPGGRVTLPLAAVAVAGDLLLVVITGWHGIIGPGLIERIAAYPFVVWLIWTGVSVLREGKPQAPGAV